MTIAFPSLIRLRWNIESSSEAILMRKKKLATTRKNFRLIFSLVFNYLPPDFDQVHFGPQNRPPNSDKVSRVKKPLPSTLRRRARGGLLLMTGHKACFKLTLVQSSITSLWSLHITFPPMKHAK